MPEARLDCERDAEYPGAKAVRAERCSCRDGPPEASALAVPMMDTGCGQMRNPPDRQKQCQEQAIQVRPIHDPTGFDLPATAFAILKGGFYVHAPAIHLDLSVSCSFIADEQPRFFIVRVPHQADTNLRSKRQI